MSQRVGGWQQKQPRMRTCKGSISKRTCNNKGDNGCDNDSDNVGNRNSDRDNEGDTVSQEEPRV